MKKALNFLLLITLISCTPKEYDFDFNGKWVLLTTEYNGKEIRNEIIYSPLLSYTIRDKKYFPAIRFKGSDSTVIVPGTNMNEEELLFSVDKNLKNIQFYKKEKSNKTSLIDKLFINKFDIKKDMRLGRLTLKSDSTIIYMMPAERFANEIKASQLD